MDKALFGSFVAELRKEKDWTQKELAEKLFVSDKAVSKWERGLSLPDVSLLRPLADALDVTVTELLEGKRMENREPKSPEQVEELLDRTIHIVKEKKRMSKEKKQGITIFATALIVVAIEWIVTRGIRWTGLNVLEGLAIGFGFYFWTLAQETLPDYYDENKISTYNHGPVRMNIPGVNFNNNNWPHIVKAVRIWTLVTMVTVPLIATILEWNVLRTAAMIAYLGSLVFALYKTGKKYE